MFDSIFSLLIIVGIVYSIISKNKKKNSGGEQNKSTPTYQTRPVRPNVSSDMVRPNMGKDLVKPNVCEGHERHVMKHKASVPNVARPNIFSEDSYVVKSGNKWGEEAVQKPKFTKKDNHLIAVRLMEGSQAPNGYKKKVCGYCAAENIVPYYDREEFLCYFCNHKL